MRRLSLDAIIFCNKFMFPKRRFGKAESILWSPNEDFGTSKKTWVRHFVSTFHTLKYSIWAKSDENLLQNALPTYFSTFQNLRLGTINSGTHFQSTFQMKVAQIEYSRIWKVLWKCVPEFWLGLPKSSFGDHKVCKIMLPKRRFWTDEQSVACAFLKCFSRVSTICGLPLIEN